MSCTLLFSSTTQDHAVTEQRHAGLTGELAVTSAGPGLPPPRWPTCARRAGVRSAVALTPTTLGPSLGVSDDVDPGRGPRRRQRRRPRRRRDRRVARRRCTATRSRSAARAPTPPTRRWATASPSCSATARARHATVVAIYTRALGFGDALLAPELAAGHLSSPLLRHDPRPHRRPRRPSPARLRALAAALPRAAGERPRASLASARRRRTRDQPLARPAVRRDHLRASRRSPSSTRW